MKYFLIVLLMSCASRQSSITSMFDGTMGGGENSDTVVGLGAIYDSTAWENPVSFQEKTIPFPSGKNYSKIDCDTTNWMLYKIETINNRNVYNYFRVISYGLMDDSGWSDAVGYLEREQKKDSLLYGWCNIKDTIPQAVNFWSSDSSYTHYYLGGIMGMFIR